MDAQERVSRGSYPAPVPVGPARLVILLAEDDENDLALAERAFKRVQRQTRLHSVASGEEAIAYLLGEGKYGDRRAHPLPHALVLDHRMPRLCGLSVLSWLRSDSRFSSMPVLILSLALLPFEADAVTRLRAAWRQKPVEPEQMLMALREGLEDAFRQVESSWHWEV